MDHTRFASTEKGLDASVVNSLGSQVGSPAMCEGVYVQAFGCSIPCGEKYWKIRSHIKHRKQSQGDGDSSQDSVSQCCGGGMMTLGRYHISISPCLVSSTLGKVTSSWGFLREMKSWNFCFHSGEVTRGIRMPLFHYVPTPSAHFWSSSQILSTGQ